LVGLGQAPDLAYKHSLAVLITWGDQSVTDETKTPGQHPGANWAQQVWLWPLEATRLALHGYAQWFDDRKTAPSGLPEPLAWTTSNAVVLQLPSMQLREFSRGIQRSRRFSSARPMRCMERWSRISRPVIVLSRHCKKTA
jgi:hypothetical protein